MQNKILNTNEMLKCWEHSLVQMQELEKDRHESNGVFMARCWFEGIMNGLIAQGYEIRISKQGKQYYFGNSKQEPELG